MDIQEGKTIDMCDKPEKLDVQDGVTVSEVVESKPDSIEQPAEDITVDDAHYSGSGKGAESELTAVEESPTAEAVVEPSGQDKVHTAAPEIQSTESEMKTVFVESSTESSEQASFLRDDPDTEMKSAEEVAVQSSEFPTVPEMQTQQEEPIPMQEQMADPVEGIGNEERFSDTIQTKVAAVANPTVEAGRQITSKENGVSLRRVKEEPTDAEIESAEDFTRKTADFPTVPRISIKQEVPTSIHQQVAAERALESKAVLQIKSSSLSLLCQYISSDSESNITDSDEEGTTNSANANSKRRVSSSSSEDGVEIIPNTESYRIQDVPIIVSDAETTATGMDESSEDELSAEEEEVVQQERPPIKSKGEVLINELPPIEDLQISVPETQCKPIGHVESIVAQIVIVQSYAGVELLDLETVLFLEKGKRALGKIFDVIGQVTAPMYCVLFNNRNDVVRKGISVGMPVYCAPQTEHTSFIILSDLMKHKGSDASWLDDNEAPDHVLDYSDDEQERSARRRRGSCSSSGRVSPDTQYQPYQLPTQHHPYQLPMQHHPHRRGHGGRRGGGHVYRSRGRGHSWHNNIAYQQQPQMQPPQRVLNPFAFVAGIPPPPPPPAPPGSGN